MRIPKYLWTLSLSVLVCACGQGSDVPSRSPTSASVSIDFPLACGTDSDLALHVQNDYFQLPEEKSSTAEHALAGYLKSDDLLSSLDVRYFVRHMESPSEVLFAYIEDDSRTGSIRARKIENQWIVADIRICRTAID